MGERVLKIENEQDVPPLKRNYPVFRLIGGNIVSYFGDQIYLIALPLIVLATTGSALSMGIVAALERLPVLLQPFTGILSDRMNRKLLLLGCDLGRGMIIGMIGLLSIHSQLDLWSIYLGALLTGLLSQIYNTAQFATIPSLVRSKDLATINAINTGTFNSAIFIAPAIGGIIISMINPGYALLINSISFFLSFCCILSINYEPNKNNRHEKKTIMKDIGEGFRFVIQTKPIFITNLAMLVSIFGTTLFLTMLVFHLKDSIHLDAEQIGLLLSFGGGSAICGAILSSFLRRKYPFRSLLFCSSVFGGMSIILFGLSHSYIWLMILNALGTFAASIMNPCIITLRQELTPDRLLGRVQATSRFMTWTMMPVSAFLAGLLSTYVGTSFTIVIGGLITTIASCIYLHPALIRAII